MQDFPFRTTPAPNELAAHPSAGTKAYPATSSASRATSRSIWAKSTEPHTFSKLPGSVHRSTSSRSPGAITIRNCTGTGPEDPSPTGRAPTTNEGETNNEKAVNDCQTRALPQTAAGRTAAASDT